MDSNMEFSFILRTEWRSDATHQISGQHFYHFDQSVHSLIAPISASSAGSPSSTWTILLVELHFWPCPVPERKQSFHRSFFMPCLNLKGWHCKNSERVSLMFIGVLMFIVLLNLHRWQYGEQWVFQIKGIIQTENLLYETYLGN